MRSPSPRLALAALVILACDEPTRSTTPRPINAAAPIARVISHLSPGEVRTIYGPTPFARSTGAPQTETFSLAGYAPAATLRIANGDASGANRVTSATITIDGAEVVGPSRFLNRVASVVQAVVLRNPSVVGITIAGAPGSQMTVSIDGSLAIAAAVSPSGGSTELLGGQVTVDIPAGALTTTTTITAEPTASPDPAALPGTSITMGPDGTTFTQPIELAIAFDPSALPRWANPTGLKMYWRNVDHWELLEGNAVDLAQSRVVATTTHFSEFALLPDAREFCPGDPTADSDLQTAVNLVPDGGTVYVCDGTFTIDAVHLNKPLTLRSEHHGMTTLRDADPAPVFQGGRPALWVDNATGTVRVVDLRFDVGGRAIVPQNHNIVEIDSIEAVGRDSTIAIPVMVIGGTTTPSTGRVEVTRSHFDHMSIGVFPTADALVNVRFSLFERFNFGSVTHSNRNEIGVGTFASAGVVEDNLIRACGTTTCLRTFARSTAIRRNRFELPAGISRASAINIIRNPGVLNAQPLIVEDNEIVAALRPGGDATQPTGYTAQAGVLVSDVYATIAAPDSIRRNHIVSAFTGISTSSAITFEDNTVENGRRAFTHGSGAGVTIHRNDFIGLTGTPTWLGIAAGNYQCNWWGSAAGPATPGLGSYMPWATVPVANTSVLCDPTPPATVRACPTPSGSIPTLPTIAQALTLVSTGGTVLVCDGVHSVGNVAVSKAVTITAEGPGTPTVDAGGNNSAFVVSNVVGGPVTISKFRFTGGSFQVQVSGNAGTVRIRNNEFHPSQTNPVGSSPGSKTGLAITSTGVTALADTNAFIGGDIAVAASPASGSTVTLRGNTFAGQAGIPVTVASTGAVTLEGNAFSDCAGFPGGSCLSLFAPVTLRGNTFTAPLTRRLTSFMYVQTGSATATIVDSNTFAGLTVSGNRAFGSSYPANNAIYVVSGRVTISRNTISNVFFGIGVQSALGTTATDNVITTTSFPVGGQSSGGVLAANRNDFSDYVTAVGNVPGLNTAALNIRCNWWGQGTGPITIDPSVPVGAYTPWATTPIANTSVGCVP